MASLTSARARNRGATASPQPTSNEVLRQDGDYDNDEKSRDKEKSGMHTQHYLPSNTALTPPLTQRPFGSTTSAGMHSASPSSATTGWVTSGSYVDKGKGKGKASSGKVGTGPLRDYGGGLGVVGNGEFKLLLAMTGLASVVRLWRLNRPNSVVFDEVHFGGEISIECPCTVSFGLQPSGLFMQASQLSTSRPNSSWMFILH